MSARQVRVDLTADTTAYLTAMRSIREELEAAAPRFRAFLADAVRLAEHEQRHHPRETPARSRMHAAYDRRRRARRRRR